jgi:parallel beta-helix repeat protein
VQALQSDGLRGKLELRGDRVWYEVGQAFNYLMVGQTAEERFQYTIADEHGATSSASVVIVIRGDSNRPTDMNGDDLVDIADLEELCRGIRTLPVNWRYDTNRDGQVNDADVDHYLATTLRTTHGDANLDSTFDSSDLVLAFQSGQYEDSIAANARWSTGDWNCDGEFNSSDLVRAFQSGAYTQNTTIHVKPWPAAECNQADRFCSIQKAVDAAERGDMILVWPGSYAPFTVRKDFLTIKGVDRDGATVVVDGLLGDNPTADGVTLLGDRILLEGLTVRDSINGFRVEGSSNSLLRNVAYDNVVGFRISGNSNFLQRNRAFANRRDGFFLATESAAATMLHNESEANLRNGYWLGGTSDVIGHNRAKANLVGFLLAGRTLSLQNNEATLNQQTGFLLETGGHTLASNTSRSNLLLGFWALQSANRNVYNSNIAEANSGSGFRLDSSLEMLVGNQSTANAAEGFLVTGSSHVMSTNGATANGSHGFLLLQSGTRLYRNQSHKNAGWGFRLQSLGNTLVENTAEGNQLGDIG